MGEAAGKVSAIGSDWGTSIARVWALDPAGKVVKSWVTSEPIVLGEFKPGDYAKVFDGLAAEWGNGSETPVLICGMAGSAQGWQEAPYVNTPATLSNLWEHVVQVTGTSRDVRILPGLAQRRDEAPDVIRGEETLLLGATMAGHGDGLFCLPGTHSKWVTMQAGRVEQFETVMTGEIFALLSQQSTLSHYTSAPGGRNGIADNPAFETAVKEAAANPAEILSQLFSVRAGPLLGQLAPIDAAARLSGLLIGSELAAVKAVSVDSVSLISTGNLADAYRKALSVLGIGSSDLDSETLAKAGLAAVARTLWPDRFAQ